jgi:hypothetical protein
VFRLLHVPTYRSWNGGEEFIHTRRDTALHILYQEMVANSTPLERSALRGAADLAIYTPASLIISRSLLCRLLEVALPAIVNPRNPELFSHESTRGDLRWEEISRSCRINPEEH